MDVLKMPHLKAVRRGDKWYHFRLFEAVIVESAVFDHWNMSDDFPRSPWNGSDGRYVVNDYWMWPRQDRTTKLSWISDN